MSTNPKDFSIIEVQPRFHARTYLLKADELRTRIKKSLDRNEISVRGINDDGDIMEEATTVPLANLVGFTVQLGSGMTQLFYAGVDPEDEDAASDDERPMYALVRSELHGNWVIGKTLKKVNNVEVDKPEYIILRADAVKVVPNTTDNFITASLDWLIESVVADFEDMFPDADAEDFDDGE